MDPRGLTSKLAGTRESLVAMLTYNLAGFRRDVGEWEAALAGYAEAESLVRAARGASHPFTAIVLNGRANLLSAMGPEHHAEALRCYDAALAIREAVLGPGRDAAPGADKGPSSSTSGGGGRPAHPDTARTLTGRAALLGKMGRPREGLDDCEAALAVRRRASGDDHPETLRARLFRAQLLAQVATAEPGAGAGAGAAGEAVGAVEGVVEARRRVLEPAHLDTAEALHALGVLLASGAGGEGRRGEARAAFEEARAIREKVLGKEHRWTIEAADNVGAAAQCHAPV